MLALFIRSALTKAGVRCEVMSDIPEIVVDYASKVRGRFANHLLTVSTIDAEARPTLATRAEELRELRVAQASAQKLNRQYRDLLKQNEQLAKALKANDQYNRGYSAGASSRYAISLDSGKRREEELQKKAAVALAEYKAATRATLRDLRTLVITQQRTIDDLRGTKREAEPTPGEGVEGTTP